MEKDKKLFPTQDATEEVRFVLRKHWFKYIPMLLLLLFMAIPLTILSYYWYSSFGTIDPLYGSLMIIGGASYALFILAILLFGFVDYYLDVDIITDRRVVDIEQDGLFHRKISELGLDEIQDVSAKVDGPFATIFHYGDVLIQTAGTLPNFIFASIPHPYRVSKEIMDLHDQIEKRGKKLGTGQSIDSSVAEDVKVVPVPPPEKAKVILAGLDADKSKTGQSRTVSYQQYSSKDSIPMEEGKSINIKDDL